MLIALRAHWRNLLDGFWFVPGLVVGVFVLLAFLALLIDHGTGTGEAVFLFGGSASAARNVLSTIAASVITVAGLALSITIVALQLVSGQFSPRATRTMLADRQNQVSAGVFVGIFAYCLLVLRAVRDDTNDLGGFVPAFSVSLAIVLGILGLALLLVFIHHMAQSIKLPSIASRIGRETLSAAEELYPGQFGEPRAADAEAEAATWTDAFTPVRPSRAGYVQQIQLADLPGSLELPGRFHVLVRPGDFVTPGRTIAEIRPPLADADEAIVERVRHAVVVADERDVGQDVAFGIQQLKDVVLRAVSPSVNDPSTAITCIGYLAACLERLASQPFPAEVRAFPEADVLVAARSRPLDEYLEEAFGQLARHADDARVAEEALEALALVARAARRSGREEHLRPVAAQADRFADAVLAMPRPEHERERIEAAVAAVREAVRVREAVI